LIRVICHSRLGSLLVSTDGTAWVIGEPGNLSG
jgi:hypothetical protein